MPALTFSTDSRPPNRDGSSSTTNPHRSRDRSESISGPPYSPITPELSSAALAPSGAGQYAYGPPAAAPSASAFEKPVSLDDNTDAIALRSAMSILQLQRQQAVRDMRVLQGQKRAAMADPEGFARDLAAGKIAMDDAEGKAGCEDVVMGDASSDSAEGGKRESRFGTIPAPQSVVRCPPVNWAQYHVVGEALDKLHEEQRLRPSSGEPQRDEPRRAPPQVVAAPYRPFVDKLADSPIRTRSFSRK